MVRRLLAASVIVPVAFSASIFAQNSEELKNLVFEPVLIETTSLDDDYLVIALTALPTAEEAISTSAYLVETILEEDVPGPEQIEQSIAEYENRVRDLEIAGGAYEPGLTQELMSLGALYQTQQDHEKALEYLDQALHISRVNMGLFNLEQESILEEKIESHVALGNLKDADLQQEYLFYLKRKAYGGSSIHLLPALEQYAEWNIFAFDSRLVMDPSLSYAAESKMYTNNGVSNSIGEEDFKTVRLMNAQNIYRTIIQILIKNFGVSDPRLLDIEKRLALTNYFFATNLDINSNAFSYGNNSSLALASSQGYYDMSRVSSNSMGYRHGREALERRLEYMMNNENISQSEITRARIDLGDWLLVFKKRNAALEVYEEAYKEISEAGVSQDIIDSMFNPTFPVAIPTFIDYRYTRAALDIPGDIALDYQGWIDIRMEINRFGQPVDVDILGKSLNVTDPIESRLFRHLRSSTSYRPRFNNGVPIDEDIVEARYYYSY